MLLIEGGFLAADTLRRCDILIENGKIAAILEPGLLSPDFADVLDAQGLIIAPGLVDMHVHLREPGFEYKEDINTGTAAAAAGGVTTCACMPNTSPVADNGEVIEYILKKSESTPVKVLPYGAVTIGQKGAELTDFAALKNAGAAALSDDGNPIQSAAVMRRAMLCARETDMLISSHCEDGEMVMNYAANEGAVSKMLGLPGRPAIAEELMAAREAMLARETGARIHIAHVSTAGTVEIIRRAKHDGVNITAETCPQYFTLTEEELITRGALARVNPPLRTANDLRAIIDGLKDGTIDAIATDHAPHSETEKSGSLENAMSGMIGLETSLALALTFLYRAGHLNIAAIIRLMSYNPARILGIDAGVVTPGARADLMILDPEEKWTVEPHRFKSKSRNTPFEGFNLQGRVKYTIANGKIIYRG